MKKPKPEILKRPQSTSDNPDGRYGGEISKWAIGEHCE